ncbi:hypothetical protein GUJ93_ZPchr0014g47054 [Zizania palustris]|uniref:Uncharacterized protein n=1 Tax=Zizania palustris TaxID=103762 RepID=A0A8J5SWT0_ZIZPA|nr:hypothetical protein GUJ93_ZPchr0014g47054 [Zizania palustris]
MASLHAVPVTWTAGGLGLGQASRAAPRVAWQAALRAATLRPVWRAHSLQRHCGRAGGICPCSARARALFAVAGLERCAAAGFRRGSVGRREGTPAVCL